MDLKIKNNYFIVGGAGSGFGKSVAITLANEGAKVLAIARTQSNLEILKNKFPENIDFIAADITNEETHTEILDYFKNKTLSGIFINAGGPPAGGFNDISMEQWDDAWKSVVRWKIALTKRLVPLLKQNQYGRILFLESVSVKQPVANLILSNALRTAVVGFAKTLSQEIMPEGITVNVMAPGYHATAAMERLFIKKSEVNGISVEEAKKDFEKEIPSGKMGNPDLLATLAVWLLSPLSEYVTGETITHSGGIVKGLL